MTGAPGCGWLAIGAGFDALMAAGLLLAGIARRTGVFVDWGSSFLIGLRVVGVLPMEDDGVALPARLLGDCC